MSHSRTAALRRIGFARRSDWLAAAGFSQTLATLVIQGERPLTERVRARLAEVAGVSEAEVLGLLVLVTRRAS